MSRYSHLFIFLLCSLWCSACINNDVPEELVTPREARRLAMRIESSIRQREPGTVGNIIQVDAFCRRIAKYMHRSMSAGDKAQMRKTLRTNTRLGTEIIRSIGRRGSYRLVRQYVRDGRQHLLFRLYGDNGINYHDYELVRVRQETGVADLFIYLTGESFSETMGNLLKDMDRMDHVEERAADIKYIRRLMEEGNFSGAMNIFNNLPEELRQQKSMQLFRIQIMAASGDSLAYAQAVEDYGRQYPGLACLPLLRIEAYGKMHNYRKALAAVDDLDRQVGGDPFLDFYRGILYKSMGDTGSYRAFIDRVYAVMPAIGDIALEEINACIASGDIPAARKAVAAYRSDASLDQQLLHDWLAQRPGTPEQLVRP